MMLDGMPCDNGLSATIDENGDLFLITNVNTHEKYFKDFINPDDSFLWSYSVLSEHIFKYNFLSSREERQCIFGKIA